MYMDGEQPYTMNVGGKMIEIWEHKYGFIPGQEQITSRSRRRFRLGGKNPNDLASSLWLLFYSRTGEETRVQANPMQARPQPIRKYPLPVVNTKPFNLFQAVTGAAQMPSHQQQMQQQYQMQQLQQIQAQQAQAAAIQAQQSNNQRSIGGQQQARQAYVSPAPPTPSTQAHTAQTAPQVQRRPHVPPAAQLPPEVVARMQRGETLADTALQFEESPGDELDAVHPIDVAKARFIKHQEWMEEIFSVYPGSRIEAPDLLPSDVTEESLRRQLQQTEEEMERLKVQHEQKMNEIKNPGGMQKRLKDALVQLSVEEPLDNDALGAIEKQVGLKFATWHGNVNQGQIET